MQIFVKTLSGKILNFDVKASDTLESLRSQISYKENLIFSAGTFMLSFKDMELEGGRKLSDYNIKAESILTMVFEHELFEQEPVEQVVYQISWKFICSFSLDIISS